MNLQVLPGGKPEEKKREKSKTELMMNECATLNTSSHIKISLKSSKKLRQLMKAYNENDNQLALEQAHFIAQVHSSASWAAHQIIVQMSHSEVYNYQENAINLLINQLVLLKDQITSDLLRNPINE